MGPSAGLEALFDLEEGLDSDDIGLHLETYARTTGQDRSLNRLRNACPDGVDPRDPVRFGPTAAAKALCAIRPTPFRRGTNRSGGVGVGDGAAAYLHYLKVVATALQRLAALLRVPVSQLPARVGRLDSSPPKLIDEDLWIRITRDGSGP
jgi:hypothetical protein